MHHTKYKIKFYKACRRIQNLHNRLFAVHNFYNMEALVKKKMLSACHIRCQEYS